MSKRETVLSTSSSLLNDATPSSPNASAQQPAREATRLLLESLKESLLCPICREIMSQPSILVCGHMFCYDCINSGIEHGILREPIVINVDTATAETRNSDALSVESVASPPDAKRSRKEGGPPSSTKQPRTKPLTFCCPICETANYKWMIVKLPSVNNLIRSVTMKKTKVRK